MEHTNTNTDFRDQKGFTLVELAVVMIIIGLLIGGVLKGQELITNAQITSTISQVKAIDAATTTFRDIYRALPGDITNPGTRLPNCSAAPCNIVGNGNSILNTAPGAAAVAPTGIVGVGEATSFWLHLVTADLISGVDSTATLAFGQGLPAAEIGGGFVVGFSSTGALLEDSSTANARPGHYLSLRSTPAVNSATSTQLSTSHAARIDRKMDDGSPNAGSVRAAGAAAGATGCASAGTPIATYNEVAELVACNLYIRVQN